MALDEDSQRYLEEAKKGKPRKFAMLCKGNSIEGIRIFKRGKEEKFKKELKKETKGKFFYGLIVGKGQNLVFQLPSDEFDKVPTKDIALKSFLSDEADMKFKPIYELVASLGSQDESDDADKEKNKDKEKGKGTDKKNKTVATTKKAKGATNPDANQV